MIPLKFKEQNITFAENQPEYLPLPAWRSPEGEVISCWKFAFKEKIMILFNSKLWLRQYTFNSPLQPQLPQVEYPFIEN